MKLTNQQIDALVAQEQAIFDAKNKQSKPTATTQQKKEAVKYLKTLNRIPKDVLYGLGYTRVSGINEQSFITAILNNQTNKVTRVEFDRTAFRNKILIASIDSGDLAELQAKLKK